MTPPSRASSHTFDLQQTQNPCTPELAREEASTSRIVIGYDTAIASKLAHIRSSADTESMYTAKPVGAKLAREEASTSAIFIGYGTAFASRLAPTF
ncbi:hypothetical protein, partial [Pseudomonas sp. Root401]|uniref:hypothetical protein n=1 Tax=Pseudomonas sp. Root401 TaxID=1736526 RepID=UPI001F3A9F95